MVKEINDADFKNEVTDSEGAVVVDFWASWCGPCKMLAPVMEQVQDEVGQKAKFVKVNVDENPQSSSSYRIASIPTVLIFKNGKVVDKMIGFRPKKDVMNIIERNL